MTDNTGPAEVPTAGSRRRRRIPLVWLVPLLTGLIAAWLAWDTFSKRGPTITISFDTASGLTAGQSQLKYKNVVMGTVKSISLSDDMTRVLVTVETVREAEPLLTDKTIFWVVKPQLFAGNITGLETLLSGSYIGLRPSSEKGQPQRQFIGEQDPPVLQAWTKGTTFRLHSKRLASISVGSPIFFRDIEVGTVLGWELADLATSVTIHAFVRAPFDRYVHSDSSFWNASGLSVKFGGEGISVQMESIRALLLGGVAFDTPDAGSPAAKADQKFTLYSSYESAKAAGFGHQLQLVSYFPGSVAGLDVGADVTLYGLKVGEVTDVSLVYDPQKDRIVVPVHYRVEAGRVLNIAAAQGLDPATLAAEMVKRGLRATLQSPSLITGQKIIALERIEDAPAATLQREGGDVFVIPTSETGGFDSIARSANELLSKINRIDFDRIGKSLMGAANGLDDTLNGPQIKKTLAALEQAMGSVQDIARRLDQDAAPALKRLPQIAAQLQDALTQANRLFGSLNSGYGDDSRFRRDLDRLLPQLTDTARSLRALTDLLSRHPEALIKGRTNTGKE